MSSFVLRSYAFPLPILLQSNNSGGRRDKPGEGNNAVSTRLSALISPGRRWGKNACCACCAETYYLAICVLTTSDVIRFFLAGEPLRWNLSPKLNVTKSPPRRPFWEKRLLFRAELSLSIRLNGFPPTLQETYFPRSPRNNPSRDVPRTRA